MPPKTTDKEENDHQSTRARVAMTGQHIDHPLQNSHPAREATVPSRSRSYIRSLPVVRALPEVERIRSVVTYTTDLEAINESDMVLNELQTPEAMTEQALLLEEDGRPSLISVRLFKLTQDVKVGIGFRSVSGELQISHILTTGLLAEAPLRPGDRLVSLDGTKNTAQWTANQAATYVRNKVGLLSIIVRTRNGDPNRTEAVVYKRSVSDKVGIAFHNDGGLLRINYLNPAGLLGDTSVLKIGDYVDRINSINVSHLDAPLVLEIIRKAQDVVRIHAKTTDTTEVSIHDLDLSARISSSRRLGSEQFLTTADEVGDIETGLSARDMEIAPGFMSVKVSKATKDIKVGIAFMNPTKHQLLIASIMDRGLLGSSPLRPGCVVHSINNVRCQTWTKEFALEVVRDRVGDILFMVQDPQGDPAYASALAYKPSPRALIGLSFKTTGGPLKVGIIRPESMFADSVLNDDDEVVSINNIPCPLMTPTEAVELTRRNPEVIWLVTKPYRGNGMVLSHESGVPGGDEYERAIRAAHIPTTITEDPGSRSQKNAVASIIVAVLVFMLIIFVSILSCDPDLEDC